MSPIKIHGYSLMFSGVLLLTLFGILILLNVSSFSGHAQKIEPEKITRASVLAPQSPTSPPLPPSSPTPIRDPIRIEEKTFGSSAQGRPIKGYEIGSGKEILLLISAIHGDERNTAELLNAFVSEIKKNPAIVSNSKKLVIIPITNPDGYDGRTDNLNTNAVNLNRNFETLGWKQHDSKGASAGRRPFSEIESRVIQQVAQDYKANVMISFHSQGNLVSPEENESSIALARWYADKTGYLYFNEWNYPGTATKWFVEKMQGTAITVELSDHEQSDWEKNKEALVAFVSS